MYAKGEWIDLLQNMFVKKTQDNEGAKNCLCTQHLKSCISVFSLFDSKLSYITSIFSRIYVILDMILNIIISNKWNISTAYKAQKFYIWN